MKYFEEIVSINIIYTTSIEPWFSMQQRNDYIKKLTDFISPENPSLKWLENILHKTKNHSIPVIYNLFIRRNPLIFIVISELLLDRVTDKNILVIDDILNKISSCVQYNNV